jgi:glycine/D-amino acid oxidase-like deaminating enzyme
MVRLAIRSVGAWHELERRSGRTLLLQTGLLWRGRDAPAVAAALAGLGLEGGLVDPAEQRRRFPELVTDERPVVWQPEAGSLLAAEALAVQLGMLNDTTAQVVVGDRVREIGATPGGGVRVETEHKRIDADVAVVTAGPWASELLGQVGVNLPLRPVLEQVVYVDGPPGWEQRPALIDEVTLRGEGGYYALPTPGVGFKIGIEKPVRAWQPSDLDRSPSPVLQQEARDLVAAVLPGFGPDLLRTEVCTWTTGPDDLFVLDRVDDVVVGTSDGGHAFKFSPLIGEVLADLAEGKEIDEDVRRLSLARFG